MEYGKLVRDSVPDAIREDGKVPYTHRAGDDEYGEELMRKLDEEIAEFRADPSVEEMADIREVLDALIAHQGLDLEAILATQEVKRRERGGFDKRLILEKVEG